MSFNWRVRKVENGEVVRIIKVEEDRSERYYERVLSGLLRNMDRERFYVEASRVPSSETESESED